MIGKNNAYWFLILNAVLWGSSYIWSKILLDHLPRFTILFLYFFGGMLLLGAFYRRRIRLIRRKTTAIGIVAGFMSILSNIFCMLALGNTSSSNTAFIVQLSVVITPLIMAVAERKLPQTGTVAGSLTALAGLILLTFNFDNHSFSIGDIYALANAIFFSLYLAYLKIYTGDADPAQLVFIQHVTGMIAFLSLAVIFESEKVAKIDFDFKVAAVLLVSIIISVLTILIQSSAIKYVRAENATVIYTLEPVAAAVFAYLLIGEKLTGATAYTGCALILAAICLSIIKKPARVKSKIVRVIYRSGQSKAS